MPAKGVFRRQADGTASLVVGASLVWPSHACIGSYSLCVCAGYVCLSEGHVPRERERGGETAHQVNGRLISLVHAGTKYFTRQVAIGCLPVSPFLLGVSQTSENLLIYHRFIGDLLTASDSIGGFYGSRTIYGLVIVFLEWLMRPLFAQVGSSERPSLR